jgi:hypothetical protein
MQTNYLGVYRALVTSIADPTGLGKIRTQCPQISGSAELRWAEPVNPGQALPTTGTIVWVAFSGGDLTKPVYFNNSVTPFPAIPSVATGLPLSPTTGQIAFETTTDTMQIWDGTNWRIFSSYSPAVSGTGVGQTNYISLSSPVSFTSTTALTNVSGFNFNASASASYIFDGYLSYTGQTFTLGPADLKLDWTIPGGTIFRWVRNGYPVNNSSQVDTIETDNATIRALGTYGVSTNLVASFKGQFTTTGAGILQLRGAQNTSNATATVINAGSWMRIMRLT